ncbi:MAG: ATP-binding cassette domain-containing protein, partial [Bacillota bacterium]|nr:ATP-binding cassette domain-containing protein [Bacillota bacterium]
MKTVVIENLRKDFRVKTRQPGARAAISSLFHPSYSTVHAVSGISFEVEEGEALAFIGPNGAGKSTTIKMLTGILFPTSGIARVLGRVPWEERENLSYEIGSVFGQKSLLWYHLPPSDTFALLQRIYEIPWAQFEARRTRLVDVFEIGELMSTPVRKLSLGQRMRCEIAASLLHSPRVIFL